MECLCVPVSTPRHVDDLHPLARGNDPIFRPVSRCDMWGVIHQVIAKFAPDQLFDKGLCISGALHHCLTGHMPHLTRTNFTQRQKLRQARGAVNSHQIAPCGIAINARVHENRISCATSSPALRYWLRTACPRRRPAPMVQSDRSLCGHVSRRRNFLWVQEGVWAHPAPKAPAKTVCRHGKSRRPWFPPSMVQTSDGLIRFWHQCHRPLARP